MRISPDECVEKVLAERLVKLMGYPAETQMVLDRVHQPLTQSNLIDPLWKTALELEKKYRKVLWESHCGYTHFIGLYGDDGEMQCSKCNIDFVRDPLDRIEDKIYSMNMKRMAEAYSKGEENAKSQIK